MKLLWTGEAKLIDTGVTANTQKNSFLLITYICFFFSLLDHTPRTPCARKIFPQILAPFCIVLLLLLLTGKYLSQAQRP